MNTRKGAAVIVINVACPSNIARVTNAREVVDVIDTASWNKRNMTTVIYTPVVRWRLVAYDVLACSCITNLYTDSAFRREEIAVWENCKTYINSLLNWTSAFAHFEHTRWNLLCFFFKYFSSFPIQNKENSKCLLASTNASALCLDFDEVSAILQALHIRALLSRSSGEMKFDSSSCMLKPVYFAFVKTMLEFFSQTTHFVKSRAHSPRSTSKIIAVIALRRAILMKANPVLSLHAHRLFRGRACSCKKDPCYTHEVRS